MLTVERKVYYCEFCKRHRLTKNSIETHEPRCIYNPGRSKCGWHEKDAAIQRPTDYAPQLKEDLDADLLRTWAGGCPACMLAVVVQADLTYGERDDLGFDYKREVQRFREAEREDDYGIF